jgi:hypothetical protein
VGAKVRSVKQCDPFKFQKMRDFFNGFSGQNSKGKDCSGDFVFTVGEQEFYEEKGLENEPARCRDGGDRQTTQREMHEVICAGCGDNHHKCHLNFVMIDQFIVAMF